MAQVLKLKRTSVAGKIPTTSNLELGELAMNTYDGRIFFEKDSGTPVVSEILTTNTENYITGSLTLKGNVNVDGTVTASNLTISSTGSFGRVEATSIDLDRLSLTSTQTTVPPLQLTANSLQDGVGALRIDGSQADIFLNPSTATHTTVTFAVNNDQRLAFGMDNNSDFYITRRTGGTWYDDTLVLDRDTGKVTLGYGIEVSGGITGSISATNGIVSGSSQVSYSGLSNIPSGIVSGSSQLSGYISASGGFTANEFIIADGTNSVTSTDILTIDTSNNRIGVGTTTPEVTLDLIGEDSNEGSIRITQHQASGGNDAPDLRFRKSRGTNSSPTAIQSGDALFAINSDNYDGSSYNRLMHIGAYSTGTDELELQFRTRGNGDSSATTKLLISSSGEVYASNGFVGDGSKLTGVTSYTDSDTLAYINSQGVISGSAQVVSSLSNQDIDLGTGAVTASSFVGDGSGLTNIQATISENATVTSSFDNQSSIAVAHNFDSKNIIVSVYDTNDTQIIPQSVVLTDSDTVTIGLSAAESGYIVVAKGGHIVSGSADDASNLNGQPGSYYLDFENHTNNPFTQSVSAITASGHFVPSQHENYDLGSSTLRWRDLYLSGSTIDLGGTLITRDGGTGDINFKDSSTEELKTVVVKELQIGTGANARKVKVDAGSIKFTDKDDVEATDDLTLPTGVISGSSQITDLTTYKETVSGASSYAVTHNLNEQYPIVQAWNTSTSQQEVPQSITTNSVNQVTLVFSTTFAGVIIVKK